MLNLPKCDYIYSRMQINIKLPAVIDDGRIDWVTGLLNQAARPNVTVRLNWKSVREISPAGFAILCCIFDFFVEQKKYMTHVFIKEKFRKISVVKHLLDIKDYPSLPAPNIQNIDSAGLILKGETSVDIMIQERLAEKFSSILGDELLFDCLLILNELMQNSKDHSTAERFYLYAGVWKKEFHIGSLDMGVTIPAKMEQKYTCNDDLEYLELAMKEGTTTRRQRTGGVGLSYFFQYLKRNTGKLTIVSRKAQIRRYFRTRKSQKNILKHPLRGTWCFARLPLGVKK